MQLDGNVLIIGDSFCQHRRGWPNQLLNKLQYQQDRVAGLPGAGWWPIRETLLDCMADREFFQNVKLLIYVHTSKDRRFTRNPDMFAVRAQKITGDFLNKELDERALATSLYFKHMYDAQFHDWAQMQWFAEYQNLVKHIPTVVNLFFHGHSPEFVVPGICVKTGLLDLAMQQHDSFDLLCTDATRGYLNHFLPENNEIFADQLYKIICGQAVDFDKSLFKKETL
jgi:hypothetical protein